MNARIAAASFSIASVASLAVSSASPLASSSAHLPELGTTGCLLHLKRQLDQTLVSR
jgi:hypothetical protein